MEPTVRRRGIARSAGCAVVAAVTCLPLLAAAPAGAAPGAPGEVQIVHGVRGLLADVWIDGRQVLSAFAPERVTDPLTVSAGDHTLVIRRHGTPSAAKPLLTGVLDVAASAHVTAGIGLNSAGRPFLTTWDDDTASAPLLAHGGSGIEVRDLADAPSVRVVIDGRSLPVLSPKEQAGIRTGIGSHRVEVWTGAGNTRILPAQQVPTQRNVVTGIYLIGIAADSSLGWLAQPLDPGPAAAAMMVVPMRVETGNSGLARDTDRSGWSVDPAWYAVGGGLLIGSAALARRRRFGPLGGRPGSGDL